MSSEAYMASIVLFAGNFAPRGWALCQGQLMSIAQNSALFSLLGTTYGGDGVTTFGLPDLRGRVATGTGQGPGTTNVALGAMAGSPTVTLLSTQMPAHTHPVMASQASDTTNPTGSVPGNDARGTPLNIYNTTSDGSVMNAQMIGMAGGSQPVNIEQPYLGLNYIICTEGVYPSRP